MKWAFIESRSRKEVVCRMINGEERMPESTFDEFLMIIWGIWIVRNKVVFEGSLSIQRKWCVELMSGWRSLRKANMARHFNKQMVDS